ncbi:FMN-binding negative transcriptional regulator [Aequorivita antarctica]|uniref:FMN-binding negative transcriptional regulator n=2 Tax=Aequorivita antarctica TaxID=153266 RepID=A0A5C6YZQ3_9FLAO|nr:FMN-binding negative transcriptional regulator [Aequorivita antarctica]TXD73255.1 FMN-binding negative transcriptional regulator [Aequorivita antarctica]
MYIPKTNIETNRDEIVAFMKRFSFATIITTVDNYPLATHLPFLIKIIDNNVVLTSHFAKANDHWKQIENSKALVIFSEPHAYISTKNYSKELEVPTWNYISVHAYGEGRLIPEEKEAFELLEATIDNYEEDYRKQWDNFPMEYKLRKIKGIMAFEVKITDLQAKKKLSQNKSEKEKDKIIDTLSESDDTNETIIADYMRLEKRKAKNLTFAEAWKVASRNSLINNIW